MSLSFLSQSPSLDVLVRLWMTQKRRDFSWRTFFVGAFLTLYFVVIVLVIFFSLQEQLKAHPLPVAPLVLAPLMAVSIIPGDMLMKLFWRRSPVEMDDYLRTRPVSPQVWGLFVLFDTMAGFMQWMLPLMIAFVAALLLPLGAAALALLVAYSCTVVNALFQNCWRRAPGNQWTLPLAFGYLFWLALSYALAIAGFLLPAVGLSLVLVNIVVAVVLHRYFVRLKNHNEELHAPVASTAHPLGEVSLWSIEWVQLMRSKRLRVSFITIAVIFLLNTYMQQMNPVMEKDFSISVNPMLLFGIAFPSIILAQWVLGVEANFFSGIWTKPWPVEGILRRKYVFFCAICGGMALLILPAVVWMHLSLLLWLSTLLFGCGVFVLPFMATCLFSSRMDLFASAFFNYQGGNKQINIFSFIMFIPMGIYYAAYFLLPSLWAHLLIGGLGLLGLALHRPYIHWISNLWYRRRYEIMERWLTE